MTDLLLALFVLSAIVYSIWLFVTTNISEQERDEMLNDEEMWP